MLSNLAHLSFDDTALHEAHRIAREHGTVQSEAEFKEAMSRLLETSVTASTSMPEETVTSLPTPPVSKARQEIALLVVAAQYGDQEAFGELFQRYKEKIYRLCLRILGTQADVEQKMLDTFIRAWENLSKLRGNYSRPSGSEERVVE